MNKIRSYIIHKNTPKLATKIQIGETMPNIRENQNNWVKSAHFNEKSISFPFNSSLASLWVFLMILFRYKNSSIFDVISKYSSRNDPVLLAMALKTIITTIAVGNLESFKPVLTSAALINKGIIIENKTKLIDWWKTVTNSRHLMRNVFVSSFCFFMDNSINLLIILLNTKAMMEKYTAILASITNCFVYSFCFANYKK